MHRLNHYCAESKALICSLLQHHQIESQNNIQDYYNYFRVTKATISISNV